MCDSLQTVIKTSLHCDEEPSLNSTQTWATKTVNHYSMYSDSFPGSHLLTVQKPASECYVIEQFIEKLCTCLLLPIYVIGQFHARRNRTETVH